MSADQISGSPTPVEDVGRKLRELRKDRQMTQADLASRIGVQQSDLCRMESGQYRVSLDTLVKILAELQVPISEFFQEQLGNLTTEESHLLRTYRDLSDVRREEIRRFIRFIRIDSDAPRSRPLQRDALDRERLVSGRPD